MSAGISPFDTKFRSILKRVEDYERYVEKDKSLLESEGTVTNQTSSESELTPYSS